jgi:AcrR family transcriptional regulator
MARRAAAETRREILASAAGLFRERGYAQTSVRDIAAAAGTDAALVIRHFGSKEELFLEAVEREIVARPLDGPLETLGRDVVRFVLDPDDQVRGMFLALVRASDGTVAGPKLREVHEATFVVPLRARLTGPDADLRARLAASLVGGLLYALWIVGDEALSAADEADVVERYGAVLQSLITPGITS